MEINSHIPESGKFVQHAVGTTELVTRKIADFGYAEVWKAIKDILRLPDEHVRRCEIVIEVHEPVVVKIEKIIMPVKR